MCLSFLAWPRNQFRDLSVSTTPAGEHALSRGLPDEILQAWNDLKNRKIAAGASRQKIRGKQQ
jgi:hypothetical protein